jgi:hypothetical protein
MNIGLYKTLEIIGELYVTKLQCFRVRPRYWLYVLQFSTFDMCSDFVGQRSTVIINHLGKPYPMQLVWKTADSAYYLTYFLFLKMYIWSIQSSKDIRLNFLKLSRRL